MWVLLLLLLLPLFQVDLVLSELQTILVVGSVQIRTFPITTGHHMNSGLKASNNKNRIHHAGFSVDVRIVRLVVFSSSSELLWNLEKR